MTARIPRTTSPGEKRHTGFSVRLSDAPLTFDPSQVSERPVLSGAAPRIQRGRLGGPTDFRSATASQRESHGCGDEWPR